MKYDYTTFFKQIEKGKTLNNNFEKLSNFLMQKNENKIKISFKEIEKIIDFDLPYSAYNYICFWANNNHTAFSCWLDVGYKTGKVNLNDKFVEFEKVN